LGITENIKDKDNLFPNDIWVMGYFQNNPFNHYNNVQINKVKQESSYEDYCIEIIPVEINDTYAGCKLLNDLTGSINFTGYFRSSQKVSAYIIQHISNTDQYVSTSVQLPASNTFNSFNLTMPIRADSDFIYFRFNFTYVGTILDVKKWEMRNL